MVSLIFPKYEKNWHNYYHASGRLVFVRFFWKNLKTPKRHFESNWPLDYLFTTTSKLIHLYHTVTDMASLFLSNWNLNFQTSNDFDILVSTILLGGIQFWALWQQLQNCTKLGPKSKPKFLVSIPFFIKICYITLN